MKFSVVAVLAAASSAVAQLPPTAGFDAISKPTEGQVLTAGEPFEIEWMPNGLAGTVSIKLIQGAAANALMTGPTVASMCYPFFPPLASCRSRDSIAN